MKLISLNCPNCSAHLTVAPDKTEAKCEHCGAIFLIDDESIRIDFDAEQAGYEFEKGRQRAQEKSAGRATPWIVLGLIVLLLIGTLGKCGAKSTTTDDSKKPEETSVEETETTDDSATEENQEEQDAEDAEDSEDSEEGLLDVESEELADEPAASETEAEEPSETVTEAVANTEIKGRGLCDEGYKEPNYVGLSGYVSVYKKDKTLLSLYEIPQGPWFVPKYALYEGKYLDTEDQVEHKTAIKVLEQSLHYEDVAKYGGYLLVEDESGEQFYISVDNFVTKDYWNDADLAKALEGGYYIAEYHQKSDVNPVTHDNEEVDLEDGTLVFVRNFVPGEWSVNVNKPHPDTTPIEGLVWGGWYDVNEYGARGICFNEEDLELVY